MQQLRIRKQTWFGGWEFIPLAGRWNSSVGHRAGVRSPGRNWDRGIDGATDGGFAQSQERRGKSIHVSSLLLLHNPHQCLPSVETGQKPVCQGSLENVDWRGPYPERQKEQEENLRANRRGKMG